MKPASNFAEQVIYVLELKMRRWQYWCSIYEKSRPMSDEEASRQLGWTRNTIAQEYLLALTEVLGN